MHACNNRSVYLILSLLMLTIVAGVRRSVCLCVGLVRFQDCYFRFGSVFSSETRFRVFSVSVLLTTKTPPGVESANTSVGLI